jgi:ethanolamine utilization protein EutN
VKLARVTGNVVSTVCNPVFEERKLLLCDLLDPRGRATGDYTIAVDSVGAGAGETVLILDEGNSARQVVGDPDGAIRAVVVGIVDEIAVD